MNQRYILIAVALALAVAALFCPFRSTSGARVAFLPLLSSGVVYADPSGYLLLKDEYKRWQEANPTLDYDLDTYAKLTDLKDKNRVNVMRLEKETFTRDTEGLLLCWILIGSLGGLLIAIFRRK